MTCAVPGCHQLSTTTGVCAAHWLEADEASNGADRLQAEVDLIHAEEERAKERQAQMLREAARLRELSPDTGRVHRIVDAIVSRFWSEAAEDSGRNQALAGAAWALGRLVAGGEIAEAEAMQRLVGEGMRAGLPARECEYVVRQQIRRAKDKPRILKRKDEWSPQWAVRW